jgi:hypothetical protein
VSCGDLLTAAAADGGGGEEPEAAQGEGSAEELGRPASAGVTGEVVGVLDAGGDESGCGSGVVARDVGEDGVEREDVRVSVDALDGWVAEGPAPATMTAVSLVSSCEGAGGRAVTAGGSLVLGRRPVSVDQPATRVGSSSVAATVHSAVRQPVERRDRAARVDRCRSAAASCWSRSISVVS